MTKKNNAGYKNIGLPEELIKQIDYMVKNSNLGYTSRGEFVKEAVRNLLKSLKQWNKKI